jgi:transcriptional regulator with XRE-family HTH domain
MTQQELAERANSSKSYISILERSAPHSQSGGYIRPSEEMVESFALALNADVNEARLAAGYAANPARTFIVPADAEPVEVTGENTQSVEERIGEHLQQIEALLTELKAQK